MSKGHISCKARRCATHKRLRGCSIRCMTRTREPKNPKAFKSMDEVREQLHRQSQGASISGALNWLSEHAFGDVASKGRWSMGLTYRWLVSSVATAFPHSSRSGPSDEELLRALQVDAQYLTQLALLMVCTESQAIRVIRRYPQVVRMNAGLLSQRLIGLKMALPECDVGLLVERQPRLFLEGDQSVTEEIIQEANKLLRQGLPGADVTAMIESDPGLLFEHVSSGIEGLFDLWPVGPDTLANSDPQELALAVRALSVKGPPRRI